MMSHIEPFINRRPKAAPPPVASALKRPPRGQVYHPYQKDTGSAFDTERNCWRISKAAHAAMLVDCANYYKALHHAFSRAKHSIFILGWDIDSRIRLLRGKDAAQTDLPVEAGALIGHLARKNPDLNVYLLRWDFSIAFLKERELFPKTVWQRKTPDNVQIVMDNTIPAGGSHHQKVIVVDDEVAFMGGMDIALERWDERDHRPHNPGRVDPRGPYGPYHDIGIMLTGPVVADLADLVRWRWHYATGQTPVPPRKTVNDPVIGLPEVWDKRFRPDFTNMKVAVARTMPMMEHVAPTHEVKTMYFDLIDRAKQFIYIENQFPVRTDIAKALNQKAKENPRLKILITSSYNPNGVFEKEAMWAGRINFKNTLMEGLDHDQVRMIYPLVYDQKNVPHYPRVHSKILIIDDQYLTVGSSNLNNRSFALDTECDLIFESHNEKSRAAIRAVRHDLIAEHTDQPPALIGNLIKGEASLTSILNSVNGHPAHTHGHKDKKKHMSKTSQQQSKNAMPESTPEKTVHEIDDTIFTGSSHNNLARRLADPARPLLPSFVPDRPAKNPSLKHILAGMLGLALIALIAYAGIEKYGGLITPEAITGFLQRARGTVWALPLTCLVYILGGMIIFPVTVMTLGTAMVFGPVLGPLYALAGALCSAAVMFWLGHHMGRQGLRRLMGRKLLSLDERLKENGIIGITMVRMIPLAPYSIVNMAGGISSIRFIEFIIGTFLGLLPGVLAKGLIGDSLTQIILAPTPQTMIYLGAGILCWALLVALSQYLVRQWQAKENNNKEQQIPSVSASEKHNG